jgi:hypothetical protein
MCSNPVRRMDVCVCLFCICANSSLVTGCSPIQEVLLTVYRMKKLKKDCRAIIDDHENDDSDGINTSNDDNDDDE